VAADGLIYVGSLVKGQAYKLEVEVKSAKGSVMQTRAQTYPTQQGNVSLGDDTIVGGKQVWNAWANQAGFSRVANAQWSAVAAFDEGRSMLVASSRAADGTAPGRLYLVDLASDKGLPATYWPGTQGGANWGGASYDPESHIVYVYSKTVLEAPLIGYAADGKTILMIANNQSKNTFDAGGGGFLGARARAMDLGTNDAIDAPIVPELFSIEGLPIHKPPYGRISALDLKTGTLLWQSVHGETPDIIKNHRLLKGVSIPRTGQAGILGTLTTRTLVICGDAGLFTDETGRKGARLRAYDKITGREVGAVFSPKPQTGAAMTYMFEGRQYIVNAVSTGAGADLIAYRLPAGTRA
jgi:hypothetical protein